MSVTIHVLPADLARGAQVYAQALRTGMDTADDQHRLATLFRAPQTSLDPDFALDVPSRLMRRAGLDPRAVWRLRHLLRRLQPDVVVAHGGETLKYVVPAAARLCPVVHYKIGTATKPLHRPPRRWYYHWLLGRCVTVAGVSNAVLDEARELGVAPDTLALIPNARDPEGFAARPEPAEHDARPDLPVVAFVGHMTATKEPLLFVDLVRELRDRGRAFDAIMVGDGPLLADVRAAAAPMGIAILGPRNDVPALLASADLVVFTSRPAGEGMPGVLIEAGMSSVPVVTTDVPGARDVIIDGETGYVLAQRDRAGLVAAVDRLVSDAALREQMGRAARQRCVELFSMETSLATWRQTLRLVGRAAAAKTG